MDLLALGSGKKKVRKINGLSTNPEKKKKLKTDDGSGVGGEEGGGGGAGGGAGGAGAGDGAEAAAAGSASGAEGTAGILVKDNSTVAKLTMGTGSRRRGVLSKARAKNFFAKKKEREQKKKEKQRKRAMHPDSSDSDSDDHGPQRGSGARGGAGGGGEGGHDTLAAAYLHGGDTFAARRKMREARAALGQEAKKEDEFTEAGNRSNWERDYRQRQEAGRKSNHKRTKAVKGDNVKFGEQADRPPIFTKTPRGTTKKKALSGRFEDITDANSETAAMKSAQLEILRQRVQQAYRSKRDGGRESNQPDLANVAPHDFGGGGGGGGDEW
jgi:hypothetical protein